MARTVETLEAREERMVTKAIFDLVEFARLDGDAVLSRSAETPTNVHYVTTETSCTCPGFTHHGYCKHAALLRWTRSFDAVSATASAA